MKFLLPPIYNINKKDIRHNKILQIKVAPSNVIILKYTPLQPDKIFGYKIVTKEAEEIFVISKTKKVPVEMKKVIEIDKFQDNWNIDLVATLKDEKHKKWIKHPELPASKTSQVIKSDIKTILNSWEDNFYFKQETKDTDGNIIQYGLRAPQIGAIYSILSHLTLFKNIATVVIPTGVGKTEIMLSLLVKEQLGKLLVIVPTNVLREQIAGKFAALGLLKEYNIVADSVEYPITGILKHKLTNKQEVDSLFENCNVIITTMSIAGQLKTEIQKYIATLCSHVFIDEAHHTEAPTWKLFKSNFNNIPIVQFTATPYRNDGKDLDGKIIYTYPLKKAQEDGYYKQIYFLPIEEYNPKKWDIKIAEKAVNILKSDLESGYDHILMARVNSIDRAEEVYEIYKKYSQFNPVRIHTRLSVHDREIIQQQIVNRIAKIIVCVDMLGEGFDLPELKIAAFHDIRKSLPITVQIVGRFTRAKSKNIGNPSVVVNIADISVNDELNEFYSYGSDWNIILANLEQEKSEEQLNLWQLIESFEKKEDEIPLQNIKPALSTVIYKTEAARWKPNNFIYGIDSYESYDKKYFNINEKRKTLLVILGKKTLLKWAKIRDFNDWQWEMHLVYWNKNSNLLFIHSSNTNSYYKKLAIAIIGKIELIKGANVFRSFHGINRLRLKNVGLREPLGKLISFIMRFGSDVESGLSEAQTRGMIRAVIMGSGFENGIKTSVGCSLKGRIWYQRRNNIEVLLNWFDTIGAKVTDESINPDVVLENTLKTQIISERPKLMPIGIDWPEIMYKELETHFKFKYNGYEFYLHECNLELENPSENGPLRFAITTDEIRVIFQLNLHKYGEFNDFEIIQIDNRSLRIETSSQEVSISDFFMDNQPVIWFINGSSLEGNIFVELPKVYRPYDVQKIIPWDWSAVNIRKESQGAEKKKDSIQYYVISKLKANNYDIIFDDDGSGEIADIVTIKILKKFIELEFYHCKYSSDDMPGARIKDLYEVCGQAQKSSSWMENPSSIFSHLLRRKEHSQKGKLVSRFEVGSEEDLIKVREIGRRIPINLHIFIVQPGVSKSAVSQQQLELLSVTENYLIETRMIPFSAITNY